MKPIRYEMKTVPCKRGLCLYNLHEKSNRSDESDRTLEFHNRQHVLTTVILGLKIDRNSLTKAIHLKSRAARIRHPKIRVPSVVPPQRLLFSLSPHFLC